MIVGGRTDQARNRTLNKQMEPDQPWLFVDECIALVRRDTVASVNFDVFFQGPTSPGLRDVVQEGHNV
jgi:hypothetical protein